MLYLEIKKLPLLQSKIINREKKNKKKKIIVKTSRNYIFK